MNRQSDLWQGQEWRVEQRRRMRRVWWRDLGRFAWWHLVRGAVFGLLGLMGWQVVVGFEVDKWLRLMGNNFIAWLG